MSKINDDNDVSKFIFSGNPLADAILSSEQNRWSLLSGNKITFSFVNQYSTGLYPKQTGMNSDNQEIAENITPLDTKIQEYIEGILKNVFSNVIAIDFTPPSQN
jgi:hypothetical protein